MKIYSIGIGGIGMSALAQYYLAMGHKVSGSDLARSEITDLLKKKGARIFIGLHQKGAKLLEEISSLPDLVIYSPAIQKNNPELKKAKKLGIKCQSYPEALGDLTKKYFTIAVSGTHGKSTTTAMLALILIKAGLDPTVIIGTKLKEFGNSNFRMGKSKYLVIEADEHMASFLNYWPKIIVLTNIEPEHLDYYKNLKNILKSYGKYIRHLPESGVLVINDDDENIQKVLKPKTKNQKPKTQIKNKKTKIVNYSLKEKEAVKLRGILKVPGEYNIYNALAALTAARALRIPDKISFKALSEYKGCWRRFEIVEADIRGFARRETRKITIVSDYGHHPTEIKETLKAAREKYPKKRIWCVFQPHQHQRTQYLFKDFVEVFSEAPVDKIILTKIYDVAGRETPRFSKKVSSRKLTEEIRKKKEGVVYIEDMNKIPTYLRKNIKNRDVIIIMGAGNIYKLKVKN